MNMNAFVTLPGQYVRNIVHTQSLALKSLWLDDFFFFQTMGHESERQACSLALNKFSYQEQFRSSDVSVAGFLSEL